MLDELVSLNIELWIPQTKSKAMFTRMSGNLNAKVTLAHSDRGFNTLTLSFLRFFLILFGVFVVFCLVFFFSQT